LAVPGSLLEDGLTILSDQDAVTMESLETLDLGAFYRRNEAMNLDDLIDIANARSRRSGENAAEELLQILSETSFAASSTAPEGK
jgi:hypothetical protein